MSLDPSQNRGLTPIPSTNPAQGPGSAPESESGNPAFRVLFERLQAKAEALEERSKDVADPGQLSGAVHAARSSLQDALSLGEELLEAFREVQHQSPYEAQNSQENEA